MRDIKFRGKRIDNAEWIYGAYDPKWKAIASFDLFSCGERVAREVDRDTVGQFTGMYDCDGVEVYEGDICELLGYEGNHKFIVKWNDEETGFAMFRLDGRKSQVQFHREAYKNLKVVGNVFDNTKWLVKKTEG